MNLPTCIAHGVEDCAVCIAEIERETALFLARTATCQCGSTEVLMGPGVTVSNLRAWCCSDPRPALRLVKS